MSSLFGDVMAVYASSLRFRSARESVLAGNIANADTPAYRRRDLEFGKIFEEKVGSPARTHAAHLPSSPKSSEDYSLTRGPRGSRPDGNGVDLDHEIIQVHRNAGAFAEQSQILSRLSTLFRTAMGSGG